jgi:hypothetical protein
MQNTGLGAKRPPPPKESVPPPPPNGVKNENMTRHTYINVYKICDFYKKIEKN